LDWAVGALYRYFPSKDALLAELQCRVIGEYRNAMEKVIGRYQQAHPGNPLGALILIASHYAKYLLEHEAHFRLISLALTDPKQYLPQHEGLRVMEEVQPVLMHIAQEFVRAHAQELLSAKDSAACTLVFWTAVQGTLSMKKLERFAPEQLNNERLFHHTLLTLFTAWGASSKEVEHEIAQAKEWLQ
jgi:AcrR family transcriptional regulator